MVDNKFMNRMQMPVEIEGKTYYGCSPKAVHNLRINSAYRTAADPVTGNKVDKAAAVLGVNEDGLVSYFESDESFARHSTNP